MSRSNPLMGFIITVPIDWWAELCAGSMLDLLTGKVNAIGTNNISHALHNWLTALGMTVRVDVATDSFWHHYADHADGTRVSLMVPKGTKRHASFVVELPKETTLGYLLALLVPENTNITIQPINMAGFWTSHAFHPGGTISLEGFLTIYK
jgi:hypothetical protein